jgi:hypothetical protein
MAAALQKLTAFTDKALSEKAPALSEKTPALSEKEGDAESESTGSHQATAFAPR